MADINQVQLPDGSQYNIKDSNSGYATESYVQDQISGITKATIGLGNVDNTSDMNKPVSTAQQTALNGKTNTSVIAYTESSATATKRYKIGDQFILNGVLYTATAIIPNGDSIVVDTNCSASDTIVEQLANISADDVAFDNTGTDLVSENVEDAIVEVNGRTKHGIVELWKNSNINANFAGQTISFSYDKTKLDGIFLVFEDTTGESTGASVMFFDNDALEMNNTKYISFTTTNLSNIYLRRRGLSTVISSGILSITFADATNGVTRISDGSAQQPETTDNSRCVPTKILGLIHNS